MITMLHGKGGFTL